MNSPRNRRSNVVKSNLIDTDRGIGGAESGNLGGGARDKQLRPTTVQGSDREGSLHTSPRDTMQKRSYWVPSTQT